MEFYNAWEKALQSTEIIRSRVRSLLTTGDTDVPYILLSSSSVNIGDTVVRKGEVTVNKPALIIPPNHPRFEGFEFDDEDTFNERQLIDFLIVRGISIPSMKYDNRTSSLDIYEGPVHEAVSHYQHLLQRQEDVSTGLIIGPEEYWQFSTLIFVCSQIIKNADQDIRRLLDEFRK